MILFKCFRQRQIKIVPARFGHGQATRKTSGRREVLFNMVSNILEYRPSRHSGLNLLILSVSVFHFDMDYLNDGNIYYWGSQSGLFKSKKLNLRIRL